MRMVIVIAAFAALTMGCSKKNGPVVITPEMEAEQKQADARVRNEESNRQKSQKLTGKMTAEDEEAARARRGN